METRRWHVTAMAVGLLLAVLAGCSPGPDRVSRENYDRLEAGMSFEEAVEILGQPMQTATWFGLRQYTWVEKDRHIHIKFLANRAIYFSSRGLEPERSARRPFSRR